jgi:D-alanine-D-alanine ligase
MRIAFVFNRQRIKSVAEAEFDTPETIEAIHGALASTGHEVVDIEMTTDATWIDRLLRVKPDIIFNTAEGYRGVGRESLGPVVFEQSGLPYVGSGPYACFLTLDKFLTKQMVSQRGVPVSEGHFVTSEDELKTVAMEMVYPAFVKPNYEGSSKGITPQSICRTPKDLLAYGKKCLSEFPEGLLIERFIPGKDVTVSFIAGLGDEGVLEPVEYTQVEKADGDWVYDYDLKNLSDEKVGIRCPAQLHPFTRIQIIEKMKRCVGALGVVDFGRADFRVTPEGDLYFIEFNALPSLQPGAGLFEATRLLGLNYNQTISRVLETSLARQKLQGPANRPSRKLTVKSPLVAVVYNLRRKSKGDEGYEDEAEFDSQTTVDAICTSIRALNYKAIPIEATRQLAEQLKEAHVDIVFNIAEGRTSKAREAQVPAICDLLGIEHTGSDVPCLALTLDKAMTKKICMAEGILTPRYAILNRPPKRVELGLKFPVIAKPNQEGTSKGIYEKSVSRTPEELAEAISMLWNKFQTPVLCEEYIEGREFTIGVLGRNALKTVGPMEIAFKEREGAPFPVYSFEAKMSDSPLDNEYCKLICPPELDPNLLKRINAFAKKTFKILGCRDIARIDFRVDKSGQIYFIEVNPLPGLSPGFSDLVIMADKSGWKYDDLIKGILNPAVLRWRGSYTQRNVNVEMAGG